jgi:hypothetical protein
MLTGKSKDLAKQQTDSLSGIVFIGGINLANFTGRSEPRGRICIQSYTYTHNYNYCYFNLTTIKLLESLGIVQDLKGSFIWSEITLPSPFLKIYLTKKNFIRYD